mmetsp:Transcript_34072/g.76026  ORF Transcript_34072/g.76026 Transcript_34072/m.76026 type:complete len:111 (+) Transcript_34072:1198-1530(+)
MEARRGQEAISVTTSGCLNTPLQPEPHVPWMHGMSSAQSQSVNQSANHEIQHFRHAACLQPEFSMTRCMGDLPLQCAQMRSSGPKSMELASMRASMEVASTIFCGSRFPQ